MTTENIQIKVSDLTDIQKIDIDFLLELQKTITDQDELIALSEIIATPIKFKDILARNKDNLAYMRLVHKHYVDRNIKDNDFKKIDDVLYTLEKAADKLADKIQAEEDKLNDNSGGIVSQYKIELADKEIYFIGDTDTYIEIFPDGNKLYYRRNAFRDIYGKPADDSISIHVAMKELKKVRKSIVNTFKPYNKDFLNLMSTSNWLKPVPGAVHFMFDLLMDSLSCGDPEAREHIESVIAYKYLHPDEHRIPCIAWHGEGAAGKNTLFDTLAVIFGDSQVGRLKYNDIFGDYNGGMLGKTVILIDEASIDNQSAEKMRQLIGNSKIYVNVKFGPQKQVDNTPLYFIAGNDTTGSVKLRGDATDRRYSVVGIKPKINLWYWVKQYFKLGDNADDKDISDAWFSNEYVLTQEEEVAKWLNYLVSKYGHLTRPPEALHSTIYKQIIVSQRGWFECLMDELFTDNFEYISRETLYSIAKEYAKVNSPSSSRVKHKQSFFADVDNWLVKHDKTHIVEKELKVSKSKYNYTYRRGDELKENSSNYMRKDCYVNERAELTKVVDDNSNKYMEYDSDSRTTIFNFKLTDNHYDEHVESTVYQPERYIVDVIKETPTPIIVERVVEAKQPEVKTNETAYNRYMELAQTARAKGNNTLAESFIAKANELILGN